MSGDDVTTSTCPECGAQTGRVDDWRSVSPVLRHKNPRTKQKCAASGKSAANMTSTRTLRLVPEKRPLADSSDYTENDFPQGVSGGLPGLGKRGRGGV